MDQKDQKEDHEHGYGLIQAVINTLAFYAVLWLVYAAVSGQ